jgi:Holliday junction resolvase RusA-like endonuclease
MGAVIEVLAFRVDGVPVPQGSKVAGVTKGGRPYLRDSNPAGLAAWRKAISAAARSAYDGVQLTGPVVVHVEFAFVRGVTVRRDHPSVKPDIDKLCRAVLDGIGDAGTVWGDDSQVVTLRGHKVYAEKAGACVRVGSLDNEGASK